MFVIQKMGQFGSELQETKMVNLENPCPKHRNKQRNIVVFRTDMLDEIQDFLHSNIEGNNTSILICLE